MMISMIGYKGNVVRLFILSIFTISKLASNIQAKE